MASSVHVEDLKGNTFGQTISPLSSLSNFNTFGVEEVPWPEDQKMPVLNRVNDISYQLYYVLGRSKEILPSISQPNVKPNHLICFLQS